MASKNSGRFVSVLVFICLFFSFSCDLLNPTGGGITPSDVRYEQVLLLEKFTGTWCGYCPDGVTYANNLKTLYPNLIVLNYHVSDVYSLTDSNSILDIIQDYGGVPAGALQRYPYTYSTGEQITHGRGYWATIANLAHEADGVPVGIAIDSSVVGSDLSIGITVHYSQDYDDNLYLTVILSEDGIIGSQSNYLTGDPDSEYYQLGSTITNFEHNHLIRDVISAPSGDSLSATSSTESVSYNLTLNSSWDTANLEITAFVHYMETDDKAILNARRVAVGESIDAGIMP